MLRLNSLQWSYISCKQASLFLSFNKAAGVDHISKDHGWAKEDIIFDDNTVIDGHIVLDLDTIADYSMIIHVDVLADNTSLSYFTGGCHVAEMPDAGAFPHLGTAINDCARVNKKIIVFHTAKITHCIGFANLSA